jgi:hypothetical protein
MMKHKHIIKTTVGLLVLILIYLQTIPVYAQDEKQDARINLTFSEVDGVKYITAKATTLQGEPIEYLDLYFYVDRTFSQLPFGDVFNTTEENGEVTVEFPKDLPGDRNGNVSIHVKIEESDEYNDLDVITSKKWGVPIEIVEQKDEERSLWAAAANAPVSLIVLVTGMIVAVWYIIFFIFYKLYVISRIKN